MPDGYSPVIETYRRAMAERWEDDRDKLEEDGIPIGFRHGGEEPEIVASLTDVVEAEANAVIEARESRRVFPPGERIVQQTE